jgi:hypothetical protein
MKAPAVLNTLLWLSIHLKVISGYVQVTEYYNESLILTPLRDGRVLAAFDFDFLLPGLPRDPQTLGQPDHRRSISM